MLSTNARPCNENIYNVNKIIMYIKIICDKLEV